MYEPKLSPMPIYKVPQELMDRPLDPRIDLDEKLDEDIVSKHYDEAKAKALHFRPSLRNYTAKF